jgi:6,7-dimethyl-8-ribityllumazine synthase
MYSSAITIAISTFETNANSLDKDGLLDVNFGSFDARTAVEVATRLRLNSVQEYHFHLIRINNR